MHEAAFEQEIECAVHGRRCRRTAIALELIEQRVGADRSVTGPHQLEHTPAQRREPVAAAHAQLGGRGDRVIDAARMVVAGAGKDGGGAARTLNHACLLAMLSYNIVWL